MLLICTRAFGNFAPGDNVEVPDGSGFDHYYFERDESDSAEPSIPAPVDTISDDSSLEARVSTPPEKSE